MLPSFYCALWYLIFCCFLLKKWKNNFYVNYLMQFSNKYLVLTHCFDRFYSFTTQLKCTSTTLPVHRSQLSLEENVKWCWCLVYCAYYYLTIYILHSVYRIHRTLPCPIKALAQQLVQYTVVLVKLATGMREEGNGSTVAQAGTASDKV